MNEYIDEARIRQIREEAEKDFDEALQNIGNMLKRQPDDKPGDRAIRIDAVRKAVQALAGNPPKVDNN